VDDMGMRGVGQGEEKLQMPGYKEQKFFGAFFKNAVLPLSATYSCAYLPA
jgi:hypothetical protein